MNSRIISDIVIIDNLENKNSIRYLRGKENVKCDERLRKILDNTKTSNIYSISHVKDLDGVASSSILMNAYNVKKEHVFFIEYSANHIESLYKEFSIFDLKESVVVVTDISMNDYLVDGFKRFLGMIKKNGSTIIWLDHHPWSKYSINELKNYFDYAIMGENPAYCAAQLAAIEFNKNKSKVIMNIAKIAHIADFNLGKKDDGKTPSISLAINYFESNKKSTRTNLRKLADLIAHGKFNSDLMIRASNAYTRRFNQNIKSILNGLVKFKVGTFSVCVGFGKSFNSTQVCDNISKNVDSDLIVYAKYDSTSVTLRRTTPKINCSIIANAFDGGGHAFAAGFPMISGIDIKKATDREKFVLQLKQKLMQVM